MPFVSTAENAALNAVTALITHVALLDASMTEITGGSPAYARKPVTWGGAVSGLDDNTGAIVFNVPSGAQVFFLGFTNNLTTGDGKTLGWWPIGGNPLEVGNAVAATDVINSTAHGLLTGERVVFMDVSAGGLPAGLTEGVVYFTLTSGLTADAFKVSTTSGGTSAAITTDGELFFAECTPVVFASQGTYTIADGDMNVIAAVI